MNFSVTKDSKPLDKSLYTWDEDTKTFTSDQSWLVVDAQPFTTIIAGDWSTIIAGFGSIANIEDYSTVSLWNAGVVTCGKDCVIIRRGDIFETIHPPAGKTIEFEKGVKGFTVVEESKTVMVMCDGKAIEISRESAKTLNLI